MNTLTQWVSMHGYAGYIWPSYGLVFSVLIGNLAFIHHQQKQTLKRLRQGLNRS